MREANARVRARARPEVERGPAERGEWHARLQVDGGRGDSDGEDDAEEINFMALLYDRAQLGVAIYNALTTTLKVLQIDVRDSAELEQVCAFLCSTLTTTAARTCLPPSS